MSVFEYQSWGEVVLYIMDNGFLMEYTSALLFITPSVVILINFNPVPFSVSALPSAP